MVGCPMLPLAATYHDWMMKISHKNADDLGFIGIYILFAM
jgi:hypothetical protein